MSYSYKMLQEYYVKFIIVLHFHNLSKTHLLLMQQISFLNSDKQCGLRHVTKENSIKKVSKKYLTTTKSATKICNTKGVLS